MSEEFNLHAKDDDPRSEKTLSAILGNYDGELDPPASRVEAYLLAIKEMLEGGGGGGGSVTVDTELKPNSTNPVQNKAIKAEIDKLYGDVNTLYGEVRGTLTAKVNQLEGAQSQTNTQLSNLDADYQTTKSTVAQHNGEISGMNSHLNGVDSALNSAFSMVDGLQSQIDGLEPRVSSSEQALTVNLLNPTLESKTANGITVTRNADNTYTITGTYTGSDRKILSLGAPDRVNFENGKTYRLTGILAGTENISIRIGNDVHMTDAGNGATGVVTLPVNGGIKLYVDPGFSAPDGITIKPMITTNLSATYDDYVPYSGSSGKLNTDYADLLEKIHESNNDISDIKGYIGYTEDDIYGVEVDFVNKRFTRLAAAVNKTPGADFDNIEPWKRRRCNLTDDGIVTAYYGDAAYTETGALEQAVEVDGVTYAIGTAVQVMVEQPKFYYKVVPVKLEKLPDNNGYQMRKARYYVSGTPKAGFKLHPAFIRDNEEADYIYLSAYEGCTYDVSASAYNVDDAQTVDFTVSTGDKLASIAGAKPTSGLSQSATRAGFRKLAHNRGDGWEQAYAAPISCTQLLMLIEYASFNVQTSIARGVCDIQDYESYNCSSLTGSTSSLGNASGRAFSTVNTKGGVSTTETADGKTSITYRGEENLYSNIWTFIDGMNIKNPSSFSSGYTEHLYVADHGFTDDTATGYEDTGIHPCYGEGYISAFGYSEDYDWIFIPTELSGTSATPIGDFAWNESPNWRVPRLGGRWSDGSTIGAFFWRLSDTPSTSYRSIGGRLVYFKKKQAA